MTRRFRSWVDDYVVPPDLPPIDREAFLIRRLQRARTQSIAAAAAATAPVRAVNRHASQAARQRVAAHRRIQVEARETALRQTDVVEQAKLFLRRRGAVVFAADIVGGPRGRWKLDGRPGWISDAELVASAVRLGFDDGES